MVITSWQWAPKGCFLELCQGAKGSVRWTAEACPAHQPACLACSSPSTAPTVPFPFYPQPGVTRHLCAQLCCRRGLVASTRIPFAGWSWRSRVVPAGVRQAHASACSAPQEVWQHQLVLLAGWSLVPEAAQWEQDGQRAQGLSVGCQHKVDAETTCCRSQECSATGCLWTLVRCKAGSSIMNYLLSSKHLGRIWKGWC